MHAAHCIVCDISFAIFTRFHLSSGVEMKMCAWPCVAVDLLTRLLDDIKAEQKTTFESLFLWELL